ncbi:LOW QUALITY PROTEIN: conserved hypothetical protein, partial [Neisseria gonorrhoeae DGI2]
RRSRNPFSKWHSKCTIPPVMKQYPLQTAVPCPIWFWRIPMPRAVLNFGKSLPGVIRLYPSPSVRRKFPILKFPTCPNRFGLKHCFLCSASYCRARMFMGNRLLHPQTGRRKTTGMCSVRLRYASLTRIKDYWGRCGLRKRTGRTSLSCMEISRSLIVFPSIQRVLLTESV